MENMVYAGLASFILIVIVTDGLYNLNFDPNSLTQASIGHTYNLNK
jgi:hypothetical protein